MTVVSTPPSLYLVTDTGLCGGPDGVVATAEAAAGAGVDMVQLRDPKAKTRELVEMGRALLKALAPFDVPLVINDRLDVALAIGAQGVHVGQSDLHPLDVRRISDAVVDGPFHVGWSCNTLQHIQAAAQLPHGTVDLLGIGPFQDTPTKPDAAGALGLAGVRQLTDAARAARMPHVVIGGVKNEHLANLVGAGAQGVAVVSAICDQPDPGITTARLRETLNAALASVNTFQEH